MVDHPLRYRRADLPAPVDFRFFSNNLDEARWVLNRFYYPMTVGAPDGVEHFRLGSELLQLGSLMVGRLEFGGTVTLTAPELDSYHVTVPMTGRVRARQGRNEVIAEPSRTAAVFLPGASAHTVHAPDAVEMNIKIDKAVLEAELATLLGRDVRRPIDFPPAMDISHGSGRSWTRLMGMLRAEYEHRDGLLYQPLIAEQVRHGLLSGLLLSTPHRYHDELTSPATAGPPAAVRRAVDAIRDTPEHPFTVADLAAIARVSVRSLQEGFRRHLGTSPMAFLQQVRLEMAHQTLRREDPSRVTVAAVAHRWGFAHLGRFARIYHARYGTKPSDTLRRT